MYREKEDGHSSRVEKCGGCFKTTNKSLRGTRKVYVCVYQQDRSLSNDITSFYYYIIILYLQSATKVKPTGNDPTTVMTHTRE